MKKEKQPAAVRRKRKRSAEDWIVDILAYGIVLLLVVSILLPFMQVITISMSPASVVNKTGFHLIPTEFDFSGYRQIATDDNFWHSYLVTVLRAAAGTASGVLVTLLTAYPLAKTNLPYRKGIMMFVVFTMYFSGGLVPLYMTISSLHLISTKAILIIIVAINTYNLIIARTFIANSIPEDLYEAAVLDGCSHFNYFLKVVLPLSKAVISVLILYYAVFHWNDYFNALMFNSNSDHAPLQIVLREILLLNQAFASGNGGVQGGYGQSSADQVKYAIIIVSTVPILCVYPFIQKYFEKGVMIGAVKG